MQWRLTPRAAPQFLGLERLCPPKWLTLKGFPRADLEEVGPIPSHMLSLMELLERAGPRFCNKMVITVMGGHDKVRGVWVSSRGFCVCECSVST